MYKIKNIKIYNFIVGNQSLKSLDQPEISGLVEYKSTSPNGQQEKI